MQFLQYALVMSIDESAPPEYRELMTSSSSALREKSFDSARASLKKATVLDPDRPQAWLGLAIAATAGCESKHYDEIYEYGMEAARRYLNKYERALGTKHEPRAHILVLGGLAYWGMNAAAALTFNVRSQWMDYTSWDVLGLAGWMRKALQVRGAPPCSNLCFHDDCDYTDIANTYSSYSAVGFSLHEERRRRSLACRLMALSAHAVERLSFVAPTFSTNSFEDKLCGSTSALLDYICRNPISDEPYHHGRRRPILRVERETLRAFAFAYKLRQRLKLNLAAACGALLVTVTGIYDVRHGGNSFAPIGVLYGASIALLVYAMCYILVLSRATARISRKLRDLSRGRLALYLCTTEICSNDDHAAYHGSLSAYTRTEHNDNLPRGTRCPSCFANSSLALRRCHFCHGAIPSGPYGRQNDFLVSTANDFREWNRCATIEVANEYLRQLINVRIDNLALKRQDNYMLRLRRSHSEMPAIFFEYWFCDDTGHVERASANIAERCADEALKMFWDGEWSEDVDSSWSTDFTSLTFDSQLRVAIRTSFVRLREECAV